MSRFYDKDDEGGLLWSDYDLGIDWPIARPIVSERDSAYPALCASLIARGCRTLLSRHVAVKA